ncbi:hypothetical protein [Paenibacillus xylanexedens]|uniref:hypothetical protein n=1 Tax=Paenibacillus xylanexedens TaxID=528191 RepID=UPI000F545008|nr:hypothetical protein [Paenibacillus xylanexedens]RPK19968.1 hypothetical protein EDO6_06485 [Paenibacillus xylanexedens]
MRFFMQIDGDGIYEINTSEMEMEKEFIEALNARKKSGENITFDITGLGILQVDDMKLAYKKRTVHIFCTLILDYREYLVL